MKKLLLFFLLTFLFIPYVNASTTTASSYILMDGTTGRVLLSKDMNNMGKTLGLNQKKISLML